MKPNPAHFLPLAALPILFAACDSESQPTFNGVVLGDTTGDTSGDAASDATDDTTPTGDVQDSTDSDASPQPPEALAALIEAYCEEAITCDEEWNGDLDACVDYAAADMERFNYEYDIGTADCEDALLALGACMFTDGDPCSDNEDEICGDEYAEIDAACNPLLALPANLADGVRTHCEASMACPDPYFSELDACEFVVGWEALDLLGYFDGRGDDCLDEVADYALCIYEADPCADEDDPACYAAGEDVRAACGWRCGSEEWIDGDAYCDGTEDCADGSDEAECP